MRHALVVLAGTFLSFPALAHGASEKQARCDAALDARTVAMRAAERSIAHISAKSGERASPAL